MARHLPTRPGHTTITTTRPTTTTTSTTTPKAKTVTIQRQRTFTPTPSPTTAATPTTAPAPTTVAYLYGGGGRRHDRRRSEALHKKREHSRQVLGVSLEPIRVPETRDDTAGVDIRAVDTSGGMGGNHDRIHDT